MKIPNKGIKLSTKDKIAFLIIALILGLLVLVMMYIVSGNKYGL